eukprot:TRINITY_DN61299_c0_g1_i1.p1 TRINITY_DN61299_c0_g1~~TRINITY_DN61299_c0_g1_i1.p1  ORF type:complete len:230 (+),score=79.86 TRINITY_DN61299_c0_g1_i1:92-691(+)
MGGGPSIESRVGISTRAMSERFETNNTTQWHVAWQQLTWEEAWARKNIEGEEFNIRTAHFLGEIHAERTRDCISQAGELLRTRFFEPIKAGQALNEAYFSTDDITRCWYPWARPKRLYTLEPPFVTSVLDLAQSYGYGKDDVQIYSAKQGNKGHFVMRILSESEKAELQRAGVAEQSGIEMGLQPPRRAPDGPPPHLAS